MDVTDLVSRRNKIFDMIVHSYIETAVPVGSRTVSMKSRSELRLSPASIRNIMADLEEEGLITHPHTSAGRIPTGKGYRYYVDLLMSLQEIDSEETSAVQHEFPDQEMGIDHLAQQVARLLSELTHQTGVTYIKRVKRVSYLPDVIEALREEDKEALTSEEPSLFFGTTSQMLRHPEFEDIQRTRRFFHLIEDRDLFWQVLSRDESDQKGIHIHIGTENGFGEMEDMTVVTREYRVGDVPVGSLGVVGPTRMDYDHVVSLVNYMAEFLSGWLAKEDE